MLLSDATRFAEKARQAGVDVTLEVWPEMQHEWQFAAKVLPEGRQALAKIGSFVEAACSRSTQRARPPAAWGLARCPGDRPNARRLPGATTPGWPGRPARSRRLRRDAAGRVS